MKFLIILSVALACAAADVSHILKDEQTAPIVSSVVNINPDGTFNYGYETGNGITAESQGVLEGRNGENPSLKVSGSYRYTSPDGTLVETAYIADEEGYKPTGSHIPVPPQIPEAIARSLEYIAAHPPPVEKSIGTFQG